VSTPLAVFDLDGTITRRDTMWPYLSGFLRRHPGRLLRLLPATPTVLAFLLGRADRGALKGALFHHVLGGLSRVEILRWSEMFVPWLVKHGLFAEALAAITEQRNKGARLVLLSASVDLYVPLIGKTLGFDETLSSRVLWEADGRLNGRLDGPNYRGAEKVRQLQQLLQRWQPSGSAAYGNSDADLLHMALVDEGIYVNGPVGGKLPPNVRRVSWFQRA